MSYKRDYKAIHFLVIYVIRFLSKIGCPWLSLLKDGEMTFYQTN